MAYNIITISRQYGAGGNSVAKYVAAALGYKVYDTELINRIIEDTGLSNEFVEEGSEYSSLGNLISYALAGTGRNGMSIDDRIWEAPCRIIQELAEEGKCVFVGRCADYILRDRDDVLNVFLRADLNKRCDRIVQLLDIDPYGIEKRVTNKDKKRKTHYMFHTDMEWGNVDNYDICLDTGVFGYKKCAETIVSLCR